MASMRGGMRRREQHRLALGRRRREDRLDVLGEAHVEHLVGLVEHDEPHGVERAACRGWMWSMARPGVATTMCTPSRSAPSWRPIGWPP